MSRSPARVCLTLLEDILYTDFDQTLMNSLHGLLNFEIGGLDCRVITTSIEHVSIVYTCNTYFVIHWSRLLFREYLVNVLIQYH